MVSPAGARWFVYILRCAGGALYTGITNDPERRLRAHREGRGARYTRGRLPVELVYREAAPTRGAAARRELQIKRLRRTQKLALAASGGPAADRGPGAAAPEPPGPFTEPGLPCTMRCAAEGRGGSARSRVRGKQA